MIVTPRRPGGAVKIQVPLLESTGQVFAPTVVEGRNVYPAPPNHFAMSPDVETLLLRLRGHERGKEPLAAMAYFCLTVVEARAGGQKPLRRHAARTLNIEYDILKCIGKLTSGEHGDGTSSRKYAAGQQPLPPRDVRWLETAVRRVIQQVAIADAGAPPPALTLRDLPATSACA